MVAGVVDVVGEGEAVDRPVWLAVLTFLRLAEAAVRRLVAIAAHGMVVDDRPRAAPRGAIPKGSGERQAAFPLFDPRRRVNPPPRRTGGEPNVRFLDEQDMPPPGKTEVPMMVPAARLRLRLAALLAALTDITRQAKRLARAYGRQVRPKRPMRPGRPPGYSTRRRDEIDETLDECHTLALIALAEPVTAVA